jgi:hypothetical protein
MLLLLCLMMMIGRANGALAQLTLNFVVDPQEAQAALGAERVGPMNAALDRVKRFFETALADSACTLAIPLRWQAPADPQALADAGSPSPQDFAQRMVAWQMVRDRLINVASGANEPESEVALYEALPAQQVPFRWLSTDITNRNAQWCVLTYAQMLQLQLNPAGPLGDEVRIRVRPPGGAIHWQFWRGELLPAHNRFDAVVAHEVLHHLGFRSAADRVEVPDFVCLLDVFRFADTGLPVGNLATQFRDLRPTTDASVVTRLNATMGSGVYPMSRGTREGGDGYGASHFRAAERLDPQHPIGLMDPSADFSPHQRLANASRADMEVLDLLGWPLDPAIVNLQLAGPVAPTPEQPEAGAHLRTGRPTFVWSDTTTNSEFYAINIFPGPDPTLLPPDTDPMMFDYLPGPTFTIPADRELAPGTYSWELVGALHSLGFYSAGYRTFTVHCRADFDLDGVITPTDVSLFTGTWFADIQNGTLEADFDGNGVVEPADMSLFVATWFDQVANGC